MTSEVQRVRSQQNLGNSRRRQRGVTLLELIVVAAIGIVVTAIAVPNIMTVIYNIRLRSSADAIAGVLQQARILAVKNNAYYVVCNPKFLTCSGGTPNNTVFVDVNGNGVWDKGEPMAQLSGNVVIATTGAPPVATMQLNFAPQSANKPPIFNARGLPCGINGGTCVNVNIDPRSPTVYSYRLYLTDSRGFGKNGWAAVTISPAGRVQTWLWSGSAWGT